MQIPLTLASVADAYVDYNSDATRVATRGTSPHSVAWPCEGENIQVLMGKKKTTEKMSKPHLCKPQSPFQPQQSPHEGGKDTGVNDLLCIGKPRN